MTLRRVAREIGLLLGVLTTFLPVSGMSQDTSGCNAARQDYQVALQSYQDGLFDPAIAGFESYLQKCPEGEQTAHVHYFLSEMLYKRQRWAEALSHATRVIQRHDDAALRAQALLLAAGCARQLGNLDQAEGYLKRIVSSDTTAVTRPAALYWLGELAMQRQRAEDAMRYYQQTLQEQPLGTYAAYAQYALGWLYREQGNAEAALQAFSGLLSLAPDHEFAVQSRFAQAALWRETGRLSKAVQAFRQLSQTAPADLRDEALFWWAETTYEQGHYAEASALYQRLVSAYPQSSRVNASLYGWGWSEAKQQRCATAIQPWETLLQQTSAVPQKTDVHYQLGLCYVQLEQPENARRHLSHVADAPTSTALQADARLKLGTLAFQAKDYRAAVRFYTAALATIDPEKKTQLHYMLGETYAALNNLTEANQSWQQVLQDAPTHPLYAQALFRLGEASVQQQQWSEALTYLRPLWDAFPEFTPRTAVAAHLVQAYHALQRCTEALPFYDQLIATAPDVRQRHQVVGAKARCLFEAEQYDEVINLLAPLLSSAAPASEDPQWWYILGQAYLQRQQPHQALTPLALLRQYFPDHALTVTTEPILARLYEQTNQIKEAVAVWQTFLQRGVLQQEEELARLRLHVGRLALQAELFQQVLDCLAPVRETAFPALAAEALFWSAEVYLRQQQWDLALQRYQELVDRYLAQQAWSAPARLRLGMVYEQQRDWERALHTYQAIVNSSVDETIRENARQRIGAIEAGRVPAPSAPLPSKG